MSKLQCPSCGYRSDDADFQIDSSGPSNTSDAAKPGALQTPAMATVQKAGFSGQQVSVRGMANGQRRGIELARRTPVATASDLIVSRNSDGSASIRHRQGGGLIADLKHRDDGTWQSVVDGKSLPPRVQQRASLMEAIGAYNQGATTITRQAMPLQEPPVQTPQMVAMGMTNIRAFASDDSDDSDDSSDDSDSGGSDTNGLNPKGQGIYKKLIAKGMAPKVAKAMAMRAQNTKPGVFGKAG